MQVKITSGQYNIVASGMAYLFDKNADFTMNIEADNGYSFSVVLKFEENFQKEYTIQKDIRNNTIFLTCYNFNESGTGLSKPVEIAVIAGKALYLMFWSYLDGNEKKKNR